MKYSFEWDPRKANDNHRKHGASFQKAATVFRDPLALSVFDREHSEEEGRWATVGLASGGELLVVIHTFRQTDSEQIAIRIISARRTTRRERRHYKEGS